MKKLVNFRLIFFIAASLCLGIGAAYFYVCKNILLSILCSAFLLVALILYLTVYTKKGARKKSLIFAAVFLLSFLFGGLNFTIHTVSYERADLGNHVYYVTGKIVDNDQTEYGHYLVLDNVKIKGNVEKALDYNVATYVNGKVSYDIGDVVFFTSTLNDKTLFYDGNFASYDIERKIKYMAKVDAKDMFFVKENRTVFEEVNIFIRDNLRKGLSEEQFSIGYAMLTGDDEYIAPETLNSYRQAGVAHVFAVSGLHVGFLAAAVSFLLKRLKASRLVAALITIPLLFLYSGVCGFSASSIRASVMATVLMLSSVAGAKYDRFTSLSLSAIIVLTISPIELLCAGFQLSFGIVFGMFVLSSPISKLLKFLPQKLSSSISTVLAAQLACIPISLLIFGEFSLVAIIVNFIIVPIVGAVFISLWVALILGAVFGIHTVAFFLPNCALWLINAAIQAVDYSGLMIGGITVGISVVCYYIAMACLGGMINLKRVLRACTATCSVIIFVFGTIVVTNSENSRARVYISGSESVCVSVIEHEENAVLIVSDAQSPYSLSRIGRIVKKLNDTEIEAVIFTKGYSIDYSVFLTKLNQFCTFKNVRYFGERNTLMEIAVLTSFPQTTMYAIRENSAEKFGEIKVGMKLGGYLAQVEIRDKTIGVLSDFANEEVEYQRLQKGYDLLVVRAMVESVVSASKPEKAIAYLRNSLFDDAEVNGNYEYLIF